MHVLKAAVFCNNVDRINSFVIVTEKALFVAKKKIYNTIKCVCDCMYTKHQVGVSVWHTSYRLGHVRKLLILSYLAPPIASISSKNIRQAFLLRAISKSSRTIRAPSPTYF